MWVSEAYRSSFGSQTCNILKQCLTDIQSNAYMTCGNHADGAQVERGSDSPRSIDRFQTRKEHGRLRAERELHVALKSAQ